MINVGLQEREWLGMATTRQTPNLASCQALLIVVIMAWFVKGSQVEEHLPVDACARRFVICDPEIDSADFSSLRGLRSGMAIPEYARQAGTRAPISAEDVEVVPREEDTLALR
jgi:hypothetical protein